MKLIMLENGSLINAENCKEWKLDVIKALHKCTQLDVYDTVNNVINETDLNLHIKSINKYANYFTVDIIQTVEFALKVAKLKTTFKVTYRYVGIDEIKIELIYIKEW